MCEQNFFLIPKKYSGGAGERYGYLTSSDYVIEL